MLKGSGMGSAWMHAGQGDFPRICVGLKLVGESGSRWIMSKRELECELVGQGKRDKGSLRSKKLSFGAFLARAPRLGVELIA
ncbi:hypothetical protein PIB30_073426 [Stylosanthes scabra]|uniref:Uncharacterized protein n=1 Tax=Stylosanthes scabra TaxID=79078 RepID=A0ABU6SR65_9FABA|nr:hypothetical protein [Stylosanthes scabra]